MDDNATCVAMVKERCEAITNFIGKGDYQRAAIEASSLFQALATSIICEDHRVKGVDYHKKIDELCNSIRSDLNRSVETILKSKELREMRLYGTN
jgi:hypothetical protein